MSFFTICTITGHKWLYKDYTNAIRSDGTHYKYTATRMCKRCDKKQFRFAEWVDEKLAPNIQPDLQQ